MPTFDEVMQEFPDHKFLVNQQDTFERTVKLLADSLQNYSVRQRENIYFFSGNEQYERLKAEVPEVQKIFPTRKEAKDCIPQYLIMLFSGKLSNSCSRYALGIPVRYLKYVPGWSSLFLSQAQQAHLKVYVIYVDIPKDLEQVKGLPLTKAHLKNLIVAQESDS